MSCADAGLSAFISLSSADPCVGRPGVYQQCIRRSRVSDANIRRVAYSSVCDREAQCSSIKGGVIAGSLLPMRKQVSSSRAIDFGEGRVADIEVDCEGKANPLAGILYLHWWKRRDRQS